MKILVLDEFLCYPPDSGKKIRTYNLLTRLAKQNELTLLSYVWGDKFEKEGLKKLAEDSIKVETVERENPQKSGLKFYLKLFKNLFSQLPYIVDGHYKKSYIDRLNELIENNHYDLIIAEWSPYAIFLKDIKDIPTVAIAHNMEQEIWRGYVERTSNPLKKWYVNKQYQKVKKFEDEIFRSLTGLITVSPLEQKDIEKNYPNLKSILIENGVDLDYFYADNQDEIVNQLVFVGSMNWRPNQDGVVYFIESILPLIREKKPDIIVKIVGHSPPESIIKLGKENRVDVTGSVDDVRPYVRNSSVEIVPLLIGGGSRLKILEAFSMRKAVVSTTKGAEGLLIEDGKNILIGDSQQEFADQTIRLLNDIELRKKLGDNGRELVEKYYNWDGLSDKMNDFLKRLVEK